MKISNALIIGSVLLLPMTVKGQQPATTRKQELLRELLIITEIKTNATKMMDSIVAAMSEQHSQMVERLADAEPSLTPAEREQAKRSLKENQADYTKQLFERIKARIDIGKVIEGISFSLYDKYFTEDEVADLISFYKTQTGKKTLSVLPQLFAESIQKTGETLGPILTTIITEMAAEEKERLKPKK